ncbi:MAG: ABC transporter ATP-binding protein [Oscillospiraceae bacterium]|nr:ABC transporter ATP-binding protein [Oscillospiraceae bacterium]
MNDFLRIEDLTVEYRSGRRHVHAVNSLDLQVGEGEALGFVGETGAGKTTTALSILRILPNPPAKVLSGKVIFKGQDLFQLSEREMRAIRGEEIAMIFQDPMTSLDPVKTVGDQICEMIQLHQRCSKKEAWQKAGDMLETVGIDRNRAGEYPHQFSGGMKQRVVIAIALSCRPSLLIADEPTTALDVTIQAQILELMKDLKKQYQSSMIMITHDLGIVAEICDNVAIMYAGCVLEYGSVFEIYKDPRHPYTRALFDSIPDVNRDQERLKVINGLPPDPTDIPAGCPFHPRCPHCMERCKTEKPEAVHLNETHWVKCFLAREEGRRAHE